MENTFAGGRFSGFLVARALTMHLAVNGLPMPGDGGTQFLAQVESAAFAKGTRADELKYGLRRLKICPVPESLSPRNHSAIEIQEVHGEIS
jgi:hypothetical protein